MWPGLLVSSKKLWFSGVATQIFSVITTNIDTNGTSHKALRTGLSDAPNIVAQLVRGWLLSESFLSATPKTDEVANSVVTKTSTNKHQYLYQKGRYSVLAFPGLRV